MSLVFKLQTRRYRWQI